MQQLIEGYQRQLDGVRIALAASQLVESWPENEFLDDAAELEKLEYQQQEIEEQLDTMSFSS